MKNKEKIIGSIVILLVFVLFLIVGYFTTRPKELPKEELTMESVFVQDKDKKESKDESKGERDIRVQIKGEVQKPGVYSLGSGSRIEDLVKAAGGFTALADEDSIVLVKKLIDSDCIIVRKKGQPEEKPLMPSNNEVKEEEKIDLNTATLEQLDKLPGIGPAKAKIIMDFREKNGGFNSVEDLKQVKGIGEATLSKFRDMVEVR